jgi:hypothetical protein
MSMVLTGKGVAHFCGEQEARTPAKEMSWLCKQEVMRLLPQLL